MESESVTVFVAGATGYTGREVVRLGRARGLDVVAHVRPGSRSTWEPRFAELGARIDKTPWEEPDMRATLERERPAIVFALLGTTRARGREAARRGGRPEDYETVDYALTALLVRASSTVSPRFVYLSSLGAGGERLNGYLAARAKAERDLRESGLPFTIVRPSFITGDDRDESRPGERVGATIADFGLSVASALGGRRLRDRYSSITNTALASELLRLALDPAAAGRTVEADELTR